VYICLSVYFATVCSVNKDLYIEVHFLISVIRVYEDVGIEAHMCLRPSITLTSLDLTFDNYYGLWTVSKNKLDGCFFTYRQTLLY